MEKEESNNLTVLGKAIERLRADLGIDSRNKLWEEAGFFTTQSYWDRRCREPEHPLPKLTDLEKLLQGLKESGYADRLTPEREAAFYHEFGYDPPNKFPKQNQRKRSPFAPPVPPTHFVGRVRELEDLKKLLGDSKGGGKVALTALRGQGGIGKTTLARQLAYEVYKSNLFGAVVEVQVKREPDRWNILRRLAEYCEVTLDETNLDWEANATKIRSEFNERVKGRTLAVFDDVWPNGVELVRELLHKALPSGVTALITSRDTRVGAALEAKLVEVDILSSEEAVALLLEYLDDKTLPHPQLKELAEVLRGHTLALMLAAKRLNAEQQGARSALSLHIRQYRKGLPTGSAIEKLQMGEDVTSREDSVAITLAYTYDAFKPDQQARFRALGALVYDQPFDLQLLAGLWEVQSEAEDDEAAEDTAREWAGQLRNLSLIEIATVSGLGDEVWYTQHPILHAYAAALLHANLEEETAARDRYYDRSATIAWPFLKLQNKPEEWGFLTPYLPHIHQAGDALYALHQTRPDDEATALRTLTFARHVYWYLNRRQEVHKREWLEMGLAAARTLGDRSDEIWFLSGLGFHYQHQRQHTETLQYYEQALTLSRKYKEQLKEATILNNIGGVYAAQGDNQKALAYFEQALPIHKTVGNNNGEV